MKETSHLKEFHSQRYCINGTNSSILNSDVGISLFGLWSFNGHVVIPSSPVTLGVLRLQSTVPRAANRGADQNSRFRGREGRLS